MKVTEKTLILALETNDTIDILYNMLSRPYVGTEDIKLAIEKLHTIAQLTSELLPD